MSKYGEILEITEVTEVLDLPNDFGRGRPLGPTMKNNIFPNLGVDDVIGRVDKSWGCMNIQVIPTPTDIFIIGGGRTPVQEEHSTVIPTPVRL